MFSACTPLDLQSFKVEELSGQISNKTDDEETDDEETISMF